MVQHLFSIPLVKCFIFIFLWISWHRSIIIVGLFYRKGAPLMCHMKRIIAFKIASITLPLLILLHKLVSWLEIYYFLLPLINSTICYPSNSQLIHFSLSWLILYICNHLQIALFVSSSDAVQPGWLLAFLRNVSAIQIREMRDDLAQVCSLIASCDLAGFSILYCTVCPLISVLTQMCGTKAVEFSYHSISASSPVIVIAWYTKIKIPLKDVRRVNSK